MRLMADDLTGSTERDLLAPTARRPTSEPLVLGVCARVAAALGVSTRSIRVAVLVLATAGGFGVVAYLAIAPFAHRLHQRDDQRTAQAELGVGLVAFGVALWLCGWWPGAEYLVVIPSAALALAFAYGWRPIDLGGTRAAMAIGLRVVVGGSMMLVAALALASLTGTLGGIGTAATWILVAGLGLSLMAAPGVQRLTAAHNAEREARIREAERSAVAAHLHDSVLQTLTLITRNAGDAEMVSRLARQQERELRRWLYRDDLGDRPDEWPAELQLMLDEIEDRYEVTVELVTAGSGPVGPSVVAALGATREAVVNAAKFAVVARVSVFAEQAGDELSVFIRDLGVGFDPGRVGRHRRGIADSIVTRVTQVGGSAEIQSSPGEGTEVIVRVPLPPYPPVEATTPQRANQPSAVEPAEAPPGSVRPPTVSR